MPLVDGGTSMREWLSAETLPTLDLGECTRLVVVAPHPDDETLGLGATIAQLSASGIDVQLVSASDGGAARPGAPAPARIRLEAVRRRELRRAAAILGVSSIISLSLPDGQLAEHEHRLTDRLTRLLENVGPGTWCAATWRGDGHPDHEAVGRAADRACRRTGVVLLEYPVWMWHWAIPAEPVVPWSDGFSIALSRWAIARKREAARCFGSQFEPAEGAGPVLPAFVLDRLIAVGEMVFR
nr:PIG-L deacetylase family protein [Mycobacterium basiliense]